jgi:non-specific serine/threonine protein kinase
VLLRRLSVFAAGWTLEAAETVCGADPLEPFELLNLLTALVDKSLVMAMVYEGATPEARYWLQETVREYAAERLRDAGEDSALHRRHRDYFRAFAELAETELRSVGQMAWLDRLKMEVDNLRAAFEWSKRDPGEGDTMLRLAGSLWWFWFTQGTLNEGRAWLEAALAASPQAPSHTDIVSHARAGALYGAGAIAWLQGDMGRAAALAGEALGVCRTLGDRLGVVYSLCILGVIPMLQGEYERAAGMFEESLVISRELGRVWETATVLGLLGWVACYQGDFDRAVASCSESLALFRDTGDRWGIASVLSHLGSATGRLGHVVKAKALLEESVTLAHELGNRPQLAISLHELARVALVEGQIQRATELEREALALRKVQGEMWGIAESLEGLAAIAAAQGLWEPAARLYGAAEIVREAVHVPLPAADRDDHAQRLSTISAAMGEPGFAATRETGRTMTLDGAIEYALLEDHPATG